MCTASVGAIHLADFGNCWWIFPGAILVESCLCPTSTLVVPQTGQAKEAIKNMFYLTEHFFECKMRRI